MKGLKTQLPPELVELYQASVAHRKAHTCGGYSFEDGGGLFDLVHKLQPKRVLELGTALGYTAALFASAAPNCRIDTIDADSVHVELARANLKRLGFDQQVVVHAGDFQRVLSGLKQEYDLAFFDGFAPCVSIVALITDRVVSGGLLICGNMGLAPMSERQQMTRNLNNGITWEKIDSLENGATLISRKVDLSSGTIPNC